MQIERSRRASIVGSRIANGIQDAEDRGEQHTGPGIAKRRIQFRRRPVVVAGNAHDDAVRLRDHVEDQRVLVGSAGAKALHLRVDVLGLTARITS